MDKRIALITILFFAILIVNCSSKDNTTIKENEQVSEKPITNSITGRVMVVGNVPFTKVALVVDDSTNYILECSEEVEKELRQNQGEVFNITYSNKTPTHEGVLLTVTKFEKEK